MAKIPKPTSRNKVTNSGRLLIIFANTIAKKDWKNIINIAPNTNHNAFRFPSFRFTLAAVILINPGGIIPIKAVMNPKNNEVMVFIYWKSDVKNHIKPLQTSYYGLILNRIYVIALLISKYCFS